MSMSMDQDKIKALAFDGSKDELPTAKKANYPCNNTWV